VDSDSQVLVLEDALPTSFPGRPWTMARRDDIYLLCKSYQGTRKIMQKHNKREKKKQKKHFLLQNILLHHHSEQ